MTAYAELAAGGHAVNNTAFSLCFMAGPAIGGVIVAASSTSIALLVNCGLFLAMALAAGDRPRAAGPGRRTPPRRQGRLRAAIVLRVREQPSIRALLGVEVAGVLFFTISIPAEVVLAEHTLHAERGRVRGDAVGLGRRRGRGQRGVRPLAGHGRHGG